MCFAIRIARTSIFGELSVGVIDGNRKSEIQDLLVVRKGDLPEPER